MSWDRSPYALVKVSAHNCYSLSPFYLSTHVVNSLEHRKQDDSDRKASIPLRESNYFTMPGCSSKNPAAALMWINMASPVPPVITRQLLFHLESVQIRRKKNAECVPPVVPDNTAAAIVNSERLHPSSLFLFFCPKRVVCYC